ncbi:MAG: ureidoglycolate lyase [Spirochaetales bacterium]|nr:ureidoglycolate lyase [Spirochaetales bacterium]
MTTQTLQIQELTSENANPYGTLISKTVKEPAYECEEFDFWNELAIEETSGVISVGMVEARPQKLTATTFERHTRTGELLAPLDGDVILVLGRPTDGSTPDVNQVEAFRLRSGAAILLKRGAWHYAPMVSDKPVRVLVVFRKGTPDDDLEMHKIDEEIGMRFEVVQ